MTDEKGDSGASRRPRSALFDPVLGAQVLGEIQAEGLRAAGALVERLVHLVDGPQEARQGSHEDGRPDLGAVLPWFELWSDLVERTSDTLQRLRTSEAGPSGHGVRVNVDSPGSAGSGELWLHNGTSSDLGELMPRCGPLTDVDGIGLDCDVTIEPPKIDGLHARSSRGFDLSVSVGSSAVPGTYRGVVQVVGAESVWMPIEVNVAERPA